jgi:hypothetical protein
LLICSCGHGLLQDRARFAVVDRRPRDKIFCADVTFFLTSERDWFICVGRNSSRNASGPRKPWSKTESLRPLVAVAIPTASAGVTPSGCMNRIRTLLTGERLEPLVVRSAGACRSRLTRPESVGGVLEDWLCPGRRPEPQATAATMAAGEASAQHPVTHRRGSHD